MNDFTLAESRKLRDEVKKVTGYDYSRKLMGVKPGGALNELCQRMMEDLDEPQAEPKETDRYADC
jgi:hypothetical protein